MQLGGITGHKDFARDCGILLTPEECIPTAAAVVRVFLEHGDRTDRKKSRLKYLLDAWGMEKFVAETEKTNARQVSQIPAGKLRTEPPRRLIASAISASIRKGSRASFTSASFFRSEE